MKFSIFFCSIFFLITQNLALAATEHPEGDIIFYNASNHNVTAQISTFGKVTLATNEKRNIAYSSLSQVCYANPTNCKADFYVDNTPAGSATINVKTGKVVDMKLAIKVHTVKGDKNVLRSVVINQ